MLNNMHTYEIGSRGNHKNITIQWVDGTYDYFSSISRAARALKIGRSTISKALESGNSLVAHGKAFFVDETLSLCDIDEL